MADKTTTTKTITGTRDDKELPRRLKCVKNKILTALHLVPVHV